MRGGGLQVERQLPDVEGWCENADDATLRVEERNNRRMIHRVVSSRKIDTRRDDTKLRTQLLNGLRIAGDSDEVRIEGMYVKSHRGRRVALGIYGHQKYLQVRHRGDFLHLGELDESRGAHIRAVGEAEEARDSACLADSGR